MARGQSGEAILSYLPSLASYDAYRQTAGKLYRDDGHGQIQYIKKVVKRGHGVLHGVMPLLERIMRLKGVKKVVSAMIYPSSSRSRGPSLSLTRETPSGLKLLAEGCVQEVFVVVKGSERKEALKG